MDVPRSPWRRPPAQSRYRIEDGAIEPEFLAQRGKRILPRRCAEHDGGRVPGEYLEDEEYRDGHRNERYRERREPACDEAKQAITPQRSIDPVRLGHVVRRHRRVLPKPLQLRIPDAEFRQLEEE